MLHVSKVTIEQKGLADTIRNSPSRLRIPIGIAASALIGYYLPLLLITLTGTWRYMLLDFFNFIVCYTVLIVQNVVALKTNKILFTGSVFAAISFLLEVLSNMISNPHAPISAYWSDLVFPVAACLLNALCLVKYEKSFRAI